MFLARRLIGFILTVFGISIVVFAVMNVLPGDPALTILGLDSTPDAQAALRSQMGLDVPAWHRYVAWFVGLLHGDFGTSYSFGVPVADLIRERLALTLSLSFCASAMTIIVSLALGLVAAAHHRRPGDWGIMILSQLGMAVPAFWLSILLVLLFAVKLRWLPPGGFPGWDNPGAALRSLILPTASLALVHSAVLSRVIRASVLEVMRLDYVRTARALGLPRWRILWSHVLPNALIPVVTIAGMQFSAVITGTIVIENVFFLPGLGRLVFQSISNRDLFTVQALVMLFAVMVVAVNFIVDMLYLAIDPRLKEPRP